MKKIISILICGIIVFGLVGCAKEKTLADKVEKKYDVEIKKDSNDYKIMAYYEHSINVYKGYYDKISKLIEKSATPTEYQTLFEEYDKDRLTLIDERNVVTGVDPSEEISSFFNNELKEKFKFKESFENLPTGQMKDIDNNILQLEYHLYMLRNDVANMLSSGKEGNSQSLNWEYEDAAVNVKELNEHLANFEE